ncbi:MAG: MarR family transcriptional regulator [Nannocystaceae bacterium]|nr:MarR family transcriptional regulator [Myxococcales bacterium]
MDEALAQFIEDLAVFFEESGLPRIAGRILGLLLVCDPPHRSAGELAEQLGVSAGSVSTMTRVLLSAGLIERVGVPSERATHYRLKDDGFERTFELRIAGLDGFSTLAERGLRLLARDGDARTRRLRTLTALYAFWERELPLLLARWREQRRALFGEEDDR